MTQDTSMLKGRRERSGANQYAAGSSRRRERRFTVAEWQYRIEGIDLNPGTDTDDQLGKILREYGQQGSELVQVLHGQEMPGDPRYRLIFKTENLWTKGLDLPLKFSLHARAEVCADHQWQRVRNMACAMILHRDQRDVEPQAPRSPPFPNTLVRTVLR